MLWTFYSKIVKNRNEQTTCNSSLEEKWDVESDMMIFMANEAQLKSEIKKKPQEIK